MKKLLVLAAGLLQIPVIKKAREMGVYVIAVDDDPNAPGMGPKFRRMHLAWRWLTRLLFQGD